MDILSHGLWAGAAATAANAKWKKHLSFWWAFFWGVFPDVFAFTIPMAWMGLATLQGDHSWSDFHPPRTGEPPMNVDSAPMQLAATLYNISHSLVIFGAVFAITWALTKKPHWIMGGWLLHILADVPTHTYAFFPTPVFWPFSAWKFSGFQWGTPWFLALDYALLLIAFTYLWRRSKRQSKAPDHSVAVPHTEPE